MDPATNGRPARPQLGDRAAAPVRGPIMSGDLPPGTVVRPETVGETLGISTTPAREGLQALRVEGFLTLVPGRGFVVAPLTGQDVRDLFRVQALVAGELAARGARRATDAQSREPAALHHELIAAAARDEATARDAMQQHIEHAGELLATHLETRATPEAGSS